MEGWFKCPRRLIETSSLTGNEKLVLLALMAHMNESSGECFPSATRIAQYAGITREWATKTLKVLENKKLISVQRAFGRPSTYRIIDEDFKTCEVSSPVKSVNVLTQFTPPVNSLHTGSELTSHPPVNSLHTNENNITILNDENKEREANISILTFVDKCMAYITHNVPDYKPKNLPDLVSEWEQTYGREYVEQEIQKAFRWMRDHGTKRTDMGRYLGDWLRRGRRFEKKKLTSEEEFDRDASFFGL